MIFGVGVNDAGYPVSRNEKVGSVWKQVWRCPYYNKWRSILQRCYSKAYQSRQETYRDCIVCEEWLTFSNFKQWMETQDWEGKELDKDILGDGKLYSPETCCFVPKYVNLFLVDRSRFRGEYKIGVSWDKERSKFQAHCSDPKGKYLHLGRFNSEKEAHLAWARNKLHFAKVIVEELNDDKIKTAILLKYENLLQKAESLT